MVGLMLAWYIFLFVQVVQEIWMQIVLILVFMIIAVTESGIFQTSWILGLRVMIFTLFCIAIIYIKEFFLRIIYLLNFNDTKMRNR